VTERLTRDSVSAVVAGMMESEETRFQTMVVAREDLKKVGEVIDWERGDAFQDWMVHQGRWPMMLDSFGAPPQPQLSHIYNAQLK